MLSPDTLDLLRQWWKTRRRGFDSTTPMEERWLFPGQRPGKPMTTRQLNRLFHEAADAAGPRASHGETGLDALPAVRAPGNVSDAADLHYGAERRASKKVVFRAVLPVRQGQARRACTH